MIPPLRVVDAAGAAARDAAARDGGIPARALMHRAGAAAAAEITRRFPQHLPYGVLIYAGPGNNGGDAWVVARALATAGVRVHVVAVGEPRSDDARYERGLTEALVHPVPSARPRLVVDGVLGTGARGAPRGEIAAAINHILAARAAGAAIVALDIPSGLDATTGEYTTAVTAHLTLTFGTMKRGLLLARSLCGLIELLDIGLGGFGDDDGAPALVTERWVRATIPPIPATAHKGTRKRLAIVGGGFGMAGAPLLAARAAMRSGIGLVRVFVAERNVDVAQAALPRALAAPWPRDDAEVRETITPWADGLVIGPGLGASADTRALVERILRTCDRPVLLDADALNVFQGALGALGALIGGRPALLTPHPAEAARLTGLSVPAVLARRFELAAEMAATARAGVLLKGVPTIIAAPAGEGLVSAAGTPALAVAGSGDVLSGIAGTLLTQLEDARVAGACAAWVHGRAAEVATGGRVVRGVDLDDVITALGAAWRPSEAPIHYPVLAEFPAVGDDP